MLSPSEGTGHPVTGMWHITLSAGCSSRITVCLDRASRGSPLSELRPLSALCEGLLSVGLLLGAPWLPTDSSVSLELRELSDVPGLRQNVLGTH